jgi:hypothetical protein
LIQPSVPELYRRLLNPGERLGWHFRDRHQFWQHWNQPAPSPPGTDRLLRNFVIAAVLGFGIYLLGTCSVAAQPSTVQGRLGAILALWVLFVLPVGLFAAYPTWRRRGSQGVDHGQLVTDWERARDAHNTTERERVDAIPEWGAVPTRPGTRRIDVFGGSLGGWNAFVTTFGSSMLTEEPPVIVLDLTQAGVALELCKVAAGAGVDYRVEHLPDQISSSTLLRGLSGTELKDVLVEAIHGDNPDGNRDERMIDDRILGMVCNALGGNPSLPRIHEALLRLLKKPDLRPEHLDRDEFNRIPTLFSNEYITQSGARLQRLEAYLAQLAGFQTPVSTEFPEAARLMCFAVTSRGSQVATELAIDVLGQWLIRTLRSLEAGARRTIIVAGADELKVRHLDRLAAQCDRLGFRLVLMFQHLRETGAALLGGGRAAVFMRLGNYEEADRAANFIGRGFKFELSQITTGMSEGETLTDSRSTGGETGFFQFERTWGTTFSRAISTSWNYGETWQRVQELFVQPTELQALPPTAFLLVQHVTDDRVACIAGDCNPDILTLPRVVTTPLPDLWQEPNLLRMQGARRTAGQAG